MDAELILTVEDSFTIAKRGIVVMPAIPISRFGDVTIPHLVELRFSNGAFKRVAAEFSIPRVTPPPPEHQFLCFLPSQTKKTVPVETQIWINVNPSPTKGNQ